MTVPYLDHFGLRQAPFRITPNPALFHASEAHQRVLGWIEQGIAARRPVLALTGIVGTGKTTLLRLLLDRHGGAWVIGLISAFHARTDDILMQAGLAFGLPDEADRPDLASGQIRRLAAEVRENGGFTLLIVDESQALGTESISALASLAGDGALTLLLVGQPELRGLLAAPELNHLALDEGARAVLTPFDEDGTAGYVAHRLARSGARGAILDAGAMRVLHGFSQGVPRLINILADYCLMTAAAQGRSQLDGPWVRATLDEAVTTGVLSHLDRAGRRPAPAGSISPVPEPALKPLPPLETTHPGALPIAPASGLAFAPVAGKPASPMAGLRAEAGGQADPPEHRPPASEAASRVLPPALVPARPQGPAERGPLGPSLWLAAVVLVLASGAAFLWLRPAPVPLAGAVPRQAAPESGPAPSVPGTPAPPLDPVAVTGDPGPAELMRQALELEARDPAQAALAYARAAIRGRDRAAYYLGQLAETGADTDPGLARMWYAAAAGLPAARQRLQALPPADAGTPASPVPVFQARLEGGGSEMIWRLPPGAPPARFRVEPFGTAGQPLLPRDTAVPGLVLPFPISAWRVTAIGADGTESAPSALVRMIPAAD